MIMIQQYMRAQGANAPMVRRPNLDIFYLTSFTDGPLVGVFLPEGMISYAASNSIIFRRCIRTPKLRQMENIFYMCSPCSIYRQSLVKNTY